MAGLKQLEFFLLRYVPDAVKNEFVNIGMVMLEPGTNGSGFAEVRFTRDWRRLRCLDPQADVEMLDALERDIRLQLRDTRDREILLRKLEDSFSNLIQVSPTTACLTQEPRKEMETLARLYFEGPKLPAMREAFGRQKIVGSMRKAFEQAGVLALMTQEISAAPYTKPGDPFKFDFGYRVGDTIKLFHAVSLKVGVEQAITLAARYPKVMRGMEQLAQTQASLTAVVDDDLRRGEDAIQFALSAMEEEHIQVAAAAEMTSLAERARSELRA